MNIIIKSDGQAGCKLQRDYILNNSKEHILGIFFFLKWFSILILWIHNHISVSGDIGVTNLSQTNSSAVWLA